MSPVPLYARLLAAGGAVVFATFLPPGVAAAAEATPPPAPGGGSAAPLMPCAEDGPGVWADIGEATHDNLVVSADATEVRPGETFVVTMEWEWRDWRPGAPLVLRACLDAEGEPDGVATAPREDLGVGPVDVAFVHPEAQPTVETTTGSESERPVVTTSITITVPDSVPPGGELCVRTAVTGAPEDHRESPPLFDISETLCRPVARVVASPSPSPAESPPALSSRPEVMGERVTRPAEIPASGFEGTPWMLLGLLLVGAGIAFGQAGRRGGRAPGRRSG